MRLLNVPVYKVMQIERESSFLQGKNFFSAHWLIFLQVKPTCKFSHSRCHFWFQGWWSCWLLQLSQWMIQVMRWPKDQAVLLRCVWCTSPSGHGNPVISVIQLDLCVHTKTLLTLKLRKQPAWESISLESPRHLSLTPNTVHKQKSDCYDYSSPFLPILPDYFIFQD